MPGQGEQLTQPVKVPGDFDVTAFIGCLENLFETMVFGHDGHLVLRFIDCSSLDLLCQKDMSSGAHPWIVEVSIAPCNGKLAKVMLLPHSWL